MDSYLRGDLEPELIFIDDDFLENEINNTLEQNELRTDLDEENDFGITGQMPTYSRDRLTRKLKNKVKEEKNDGNIEMIGQTPLHPRNRLA